MRTTVVGNYPKLSDRPGVPNLRRALSRLDRGQITPEELRQVQEAVIRDAIQEQVEAGIDLVTDGQITWDDGQTYFARRIKGFEINGLTRYFDNNVYYRQPVAVSRVEWQGPIGVEDYRFAVSVSPQPVKAVITGPYTLAKLSQLGSYNSLRDLAVDLAFILNREAQALQEAGAPFIQFDEPAIVRFKEDFPLLYEVSRIVTRGLTVTTEVRTYFGDVSGIHLQFFQLPFDYIGLDFVSGPANYRLLEDFPPEKSLDAGIVDARNTKLETVEEMVESLRRICTHTSAERLYVSPSAGLEFLPRDKARAKLHRLVEGVRRAKEVLNA